MANQENDVFDFAHNFVYGGSNDINSTTYAFTDQVFGPMARDLRMLLEERFAEGSGIEEIPASDRVVRIDHNSAEYRQAIEALDRLEHTLRTANDFDDPEEQEQRIIEVQASKTLLRAIRVRVQAMIELLRPLAVQFGNKLKDNLMTIAVDQPAGRPRVVFGNPLLDRGEIALCCRLENDPHATSGAS